MADKRIKIEVFPDYIETILIALHEKREWHDKQDDKEKEQVDDAIIAWITQIILDIGNQYKSEKKEDEK